MSGIMTRSAQPGFGQMEDLSTPEKYLLNFNFMSTKPENIKVTLKGRLQLQVEVEVEMPCNTT